MKTHGTPCLQAYNKELSRYFSEYLKRTKIYRDIDKLYLMCIKPYQFNGSK